MGKKQRPVTIRGKSYPSMSAAARDLGVRVPTIARAIQRGTLENAGLRVNRRKPVVIRGVEYESQLDAARALGVAHSVISTAKKRGTLQFVGLGRRASLSRQRKGALISSFAHNPGDEDW